MIHQITVNEVKKANPVYFEAAEFMGDRTDTYQVVYISNLPWFYLQSGFDDMPAVDLFIPVNQNSFKLGSSIKCDPKKAKETLKASTYFDNIK